MVKNFDHLAKGSFAEFGDDLEPVRDVVSEVRYVEPLLVVKSAVLLAEVLSVLFVHVVDCVNL